MKDEELLKLIRKDTSYGIEVAINQYGNSVKTICRAILAGFSEEDIEEAVSDTFVGLWKAQDKIKSERETGLKEYLYGIARKTALNRRRKLSKQQVEQDIDEAFDISSGEDLEKNVLDKADCRILYQLINAMKSPDKEIFILRFCNQLSIKEIAEKLELKAKSVENKLSRGKVKLKEELIKVGIEVA